MSNETGLLDENATGQQSAPVQKPNGRADDTSCPQCGSRKSWGQSSWCPDCGHYPTLDGSDGSKGNSVQIAAEFRDDGEVEPVTLLNAIPVWMWIALGGVGAIFTLSVCLRVYFDKYGGSPSTFSWTALCGGLTAMITAHVLALRYAKTNDARITLSDGLVAWIAVWQPTVATLPGSCRRLWSLIWGGTVCFCAIAITGGMNLDWLLVPGEPFYEKKDTGAAIGAIADAAKSQKPDAESMEEALHNLAGEAGKDEEQSDASATNAQEPENLVTATIFGFQANRKGVPIRFLFSGTTRTRRQHIATIATEDLTEDQLKIIVMRLHNTLVRTPATPTYLNGTWVKPLVDCRLEYDSIAANGNLVNPRLYEVFKQNSDANDSGQDGEDDSSEDAADASHGREGRGASSGR